MEFELDYRFRIEQDWSSKKSDGTFREDRSRFRYRLRTGAVYKSNNYSVGVRLRTGDPRKQQDPQLTLGKGLKEFGTLPIGFEKAYFEFSKNSFTIWAGKNTYPFVKSNELFWSDNVFPEGIALKKRFTIKSNVFERIKFIAGHFILSSNDRSIFKDGYFQGLQSSISTKNNHLILFSTIYLFRNIPNIPDGGHTHILDYSILHLGSKFKLPTKKEVSIEFDYYQNIEDYTFDMNIDSELRDQKTGYTIGVKYGELKVKNDWFLKLTYSHLERYSILDYVAQNDWARWSYSSYDSPDGRLSNLQGVEFVFAYSLTEKINFVSKYYLVEQLVPDGVAKETGQRIRFDINIKI